MSFRVAVDIGGTFTDLIAVDLESGDLVASKVPSRPDDPGAALGEALHEAGIDAGEIELFFHGTTYGLNIVLEGKGVDVALLTTEGFRDVLEIRRATWPMYNLHWTPPPALVPRRHRFEVTERIAADGRVLVQLDEESVRGALRAVESHGITAVAVCLLHAYAFPQHEQRIGEICEREFPRLSCTLSHGVTREYREYERSVTTVLEASISKRMGQYLMGIERSLESGGFRGSFLVTRMDGGVMSVAEAIGKPVRTLTSGPASGIVGAATLGALAGYPNLLTIDMGGTSFDAGIVTGGQPSLAAATVLREMPLLLPNVEIATIGAGGGSLARVEDGGALAVGPESAGAEPGPISYGRGGTVPTFTDAALVSGLISPATFAGGRIPLTVDSAATAIDEQVAAPLQLDRTEAAAGIVHVVEANMASLLESITIEKGIDPREFVVFAYGGGGPLVAATLADSLGIGTVVVPPYPGLFSAWGMLNLDVVHDFAHTSIRSLDSLSVGAVAEIFAALETDGHDSLEREGVAEPERRFARTVDLRYVGQEHTLGVAVGGFADDEAMRRLFRSAFDRVHQQTYGYTIDGGIEVVAMRVRALGTLAHPTRPRGATHGPRSDSGGNGTRLVWHRASGGPSTCKVRLRSELVVGERIPGPAIVEEASATTFVPRGWEAAVDPEQNLVLTATGEGDG